MLIKVEGILLLYLNKAEKVVGEEGREKLNKEKIWYTLYCLHKVIHPFNQPIHSFNLHKVIHPFNLLKHLKGTMQDLF